MADFLLLLAFSICLALVNGAPANARFIPDQVVSSKILFSLSEAKRDNGDTEIIGHINVEGGLGCDIDRGVTIKRAILFKPDTVVREITTDQHGHWRGEIDLKPREMRRQGYYAVVRQSFYHHNSFSADCQQDESEVVHPNS